MIRGRQNKKQIIALLIIRMTILFDTKTVYPLPKQFRYPLPKLHFCTTLSLLIFASTQDVPPLHEEDQEEGESTARQPRDLHINHSKTLTAPLAI